VHRVFAGSGPARRGISAPAPRIRLAPTGARSRVDAGQVDRGFEALVGSLGPRVLLVCTANICRSPAAARLLAGRLGPQIEFASRGTRAVRGAHACEVASNWALMNGGDFGGGHVARQLELADIRAATLILTASRRQRAKVVELRPSAQVRTFTLLQAARIARWRAPAAGGRPRGMPADADLPDRLLWLGEELDACRAAAPRPDLESADDLPDPHHGAPHADVLAALIEAVDSICAPLLVVR
jgi:protein-tyrosine phosphatase